jgi:hypothetical protein
MISNETETLAVCVDCAMMAANREGAAAEWRGFDPWLESARLAVGSGPAWFGPFPCDACGDEWAGDRLELVAMW